MPSVTTRKTRTGKSRPAPASVKHNRRASNGADANTQEKELLAWRKEFPILSKRIYLINNSLGAMPRAVHDRLHEYADKWETDGVEAWWDWLPMVTEVGNLIGRIIGAPKNSIMLHQNVATLTSMVLSAFDFSGRRNKLVYDTMQFTSPHYVIQAWSKYGAKPVMVKSADGIHVSTQDIVDAIDENTALVPISHVLFRSGYLHDVKPIIEKAHKVGAYVLLDCYQSAGSVPIDVKKLGVDFLVGGSVKWLCGGGGVCYLYVRPDLQKKFSPAMTGWFSHKRPFKFEMEMDEADDIHRWMGGSPNVPGLYSARSGYEIIGKVGVNNISRKSMRQTQMIVDSASEMGLKVNSPANA